MVERFYIDLSNVDCREQLYEVLTDALPLPDRCGRNLDALYDVFTGELHDVRLFFRGSQHAETQLGGYFTMFQTMCREASEQNPNVQIFFL